MTPLTRDDVHDTCPLSERPAYVVFSRHQPMFGDAFWKITCVTAHIDRALSWANAAINDKGERETCLVFGCRAALAENLRAAQRTYDDFEMDAFRFSRVAAQ